MKKFILILAFTINIFASDATEILEKTKQLTDYDNMYSISTMTIEKDGKVTSTMVSDNYYKTVGEDDYQLIRYTDPARLKGTAILVKGDNTWYYNKRTNRLRLLTTSAKEGSMMGSSFSYDDMSLDYIKDFDSELLEEKKGVYEIKLLPKGKKKFKYLLAYIDAETLLEKEVRYYDENGIEYKRLVLDDYKKVADKWIPLNITMNSILEGKTTRVATDLTSIDIESELNDKVFSQRELKK